MARRPIDHTEERTRRRRGRAVTAAEVIEFLEYIAPPSLALPVEPYGLQVGLPAGQVRTVVVAPLASFHALSTAASRRDAMLVCAAPLLTEPLTSVRRDDPIGSKLAYLLEHRIAFYALANTCAAAPGGFDDCLADRLGLVAHSSLQPTACELLYKVAIFVPVKDVDRVLAAAGEAGAGGIGNYSHCSFQVRGEGTFVPKTGAKPAIGTVGRLERVEESRVEMIVPQRELQGVIAAVLEAHPYEEVAYDVVALKNPGQVYGRGRIGDLPLQVSLETVLAQVHDGLGAPSVRCSQRTEMPISSLAVASGAAGGLLWHAVKAGAGAFVTGGLSMTDRMIADNSTTLVIDVGYEASVAPGLQELANHLVETFEQDGLEVVYGD
jgi:hypothetical protein